MRSFVLAVGLVTVSTLAAAAQTSPAASPPPSNQAPDARAEQLTRIQALPWQDVHDLRLPQSKATLDKMTGFVGLAGADAQTYRSIIEGPDESSIEGVAVRRGRDSELVYSWHDVGYVDAQDFSDIDPAKLIQSVRDATFAHNEETARRGQHPFTAVDWLRQPTWNERLHTAYWMMQGVQDDGSRTVNAIALKLGRRGYEKMVWITSPDEIGRANDLTLAQDAFKYPLGDRYEDHASGDRIAAYGIAGLVAGVIGLKAAKIVGIGALLLVLKKFFVVLLVPFIWLANKIKSLFRRQDG